MTQKKPLFAIPSFPGSNGEVDNMRVLKRCGFDCFVFRWNESQERLKEVDGYFFGAGFSYEDRGRSGMVAARDPLFEHIRAEAERGKVVIGNCNGAQVLIESGLVPLGDGLRMCLAHNAIREGVSWKSPGFLNEWVWITPGCSKDRCATSNWSGAMHIPIAHGEGRFITRDKDLVQELEKNNQIAFRYCDEHGKCSSEAPVTPNGSTFGIAGLCNKEGNVVCLMPHPERTPLGDRYFVSVREWVLKRKRTKAVVSKGAISAFQPPVRNALPLEIFIETIITNNEERTVEQAAKRILSNLSLKQYRYLGLRKDIVQQLLGSLSFFNPNKEIAYIRKDGHFYHWLPDSKKLSKTERPILKGLSLLRRDEPDTLGLSFGDGTESGVCYDCRTDDYSKVLMSNVCEIFANPHASSLERMV